MVLTGDTRRRVAHIVPNLLAARSEKVFVGDRVVMVNRKPIAAYRRDRLIDILDQVGDSRQIELQLRYALSFAVIFELSS